MTKLISITNPKELKKLYQNERNRVHGQETTSFTLEQSLSTDGSKM